MKRLGSLRLKVALSFAAFCVLVIAGHSLALLLVTEDQEDRLVNQLIAEEMNHVVQRYRANGEISLPRSENLQAYVTRDERERRALPAMLRDLPAGEHEIRLPDGEETHVAVRREGGAYFYLLYDVSFHEQRLSQFKWFLFFSLIAAAAFTLWLGYVLSGLLVRPVAQLAERVAQLGPASGQSPLAERFHDREVAVLARAFDTYQHRVDELLAAEKEFTANVSHELRTPLTGIRTGCELVLQEPGLTEKSRHRLENMAAAVDRIARLTDSLLSVARQELGGEVDAFALAECVEEALQPLRETAAEKGLALGVEIAPQIMLHANRQALLLVLGNLLKNALAYTESGTIRVRYREGRLEVADTGPGIPPEEIPFIFHRFQRGAARRGEGHGLGLAIVQRVCRQFGWELNVESTPGQGSTFSIRLSTSRKLHEIPTKT